MFSNMGITSSQITKSWKWTQLASIAGGINNAPTSKNQVTTTDGFGLMTSSTMAVSFRIDTNTDVITETPSKNLDLQGDNPCWCNVGTTLYMQNYGSLFIYNYSTNSYTRKTSPPFDDPSCEMVKIDDNHIWVGLGKNLGKSAIYTISTNTWSSASSAQVFMRYFGYCLLDNAKIFITNDTRYILCNTTNNTYSTVATRSAISRNGAMVCSIPTGAIICGGKDASNNLLSSTEIYNMTTDTFSVGPNMVYARAFGDIAKMQNGNVALYGGGSLYVEVYNVASNSFSLLSPLPDPISAHGGEGSEMIYNPVNNSFYVYSGSSVVTKLSLS